jgi:hypothetical protein
MFTVFDKKEMLRSHSDLYNLIFEKWLETLQKNLGRWAGYQLAGLTGYIPYPALNFLDIRNIRIMCIPIQHNLFIDMG